jgi:hypothetical protein
MEYGKWKSGGRCVMTPMEKYNLVNSFMAQPPVQIGSYLACTWFIFLVFNAGAKAWRNIRGPVPNPSNEVLGQSSAQLEQRIRSHEDRMNALSERMLKDKEQILASGSTRGRTIYDKIDSTEDQLRKEMSHLRDRMDPVIENLAHIKGQMEGFTESFRNFASMKQQEQKTT